MRRRIACLAALLLLLMPLAGCWNYREVESLYVVAGFAVDQGYEGYKYHLTMDVADTTNAGKDKPVVTTLIESEGDTIFDAIRNATRSTGFKLYWPNCQIVIIGQDVASESILPVIDYLLRDAEPRLTMEVFISEAKTAKEILQQKPLTMSIVSFEIDKAYELNEKAQPVALYQVLYEVYNTLSSDGHALALPALGLIDNNGQKTCRLNGMAVFARDKLKAFMTAKDSATALYVMDKVKGGVLPVRSPQGNAIAALEIYSNKTTVRPVVENGTIRFVVTTQTEVALNEMDTAVDLMRDEKYKDIEAMASEQLRDEILRVIRLVQSGPDEDIFGFGALLHRSDPDAWYRVRENWNDTFRTVEVDVSCNITIRNSASARGAVEVGD